jgi:hypothetical protein
MPVKTTIQVRRDTAANWTSINPTLASGEIGLETDTNKTKFGNGSSTWTALSYSASGLKVSDTAPTGATSGDMWLDSTTGKTYTYYDSFWVEQNGANSGKDGYSPTGNVIINGGFDFWQRGTTFTNISQQYTADRWFFYPYGAGQPYTISRQTSGAPTGFSAYLRAVQSGATSSNIFMAYTLETADVIKLAGQSATLSFWYKIPVNFSQAVYANINYNTSVDSPPTTVIPSGTSILNTALTNTTSWTKVSFTVNVPSTATSMTVYLASTNSTVSGATLDFTGVQLEIGSVATPFSRAGGTLQGELAACQRYYWRSAGTANYMPHPTSGYVFSSTQANITLTYPVSMRTAPTSVEYANLCINDSSNASWAISAITLDNAGSNSTSLNCTISGATAGRFGRIINNNNAAGYLGVSAEP